MSRLDGRFAALAAAGVPAFIPFTMAGDPGPSASLRLLQGLIGAGADILEIGMPFSDPMADGPSIEAAGLRALRAGMTLRGTLDLVRALRTTDATTPVVLMGYFNPIHAYGPEGFARDAAAAGVDGLIIVDLPPEEAAVLSGPARTAGLDLIRLATPTTDAARLPRVLADASGFLYYVSVAGVTGAASGALAEIAAAVTRLRAASGMPVAVGFGIKTEDRASSIARIADGVVVGSALVETMARAGTDGDEAAINQTLSLAERLCRAIKTARDPR